jgi:hypothetical protein
MSNNHIDLQTQIQNLTQTTKHQLSIASKTPDLLSLVLNISMNLNYSTL